MDVIYLMFNSGIWAAAHRYKKNYYLIRVANDRDSKESSIPRLIQNLKTVDRVPSIFFN